MSDITTAIATRQAQITQLQNDIETLQRAAGIMGGKTASAKATRQPKATPQPMPKRRSMTAAERAAVGKRMKAYWAKRKKASAATAAQPKAAKKRARKPMSAAAKKALSKRMKASWAKQRKAKR